mmetsp:Transcript_1722/g.5107  ORF Transcript_1722/g.5107 Transcript_1722/m.5107 type:complete len:214 (-) Transcript_1722:1154-1795(-)
MTTLATKDAPWIAAPATWARAIAHALATSDAISSALSDTKPPASHPSTPDPPAAAPPLQPAPPSSSSSCRCCCQPAASDPTSWPASSGCSRPGDTSSTPFGDATKLSPTQPSSLAPSPLPLRPPLLLPPPPPPSVRTGTIASSSPSNDSSLSARRAPGRATRMTSSAMTLVYESRARASTNTSTSSAPARTLSFPGGSGLQEAAATRMATRGA